MLVPTAKSLPEFTDDIFFATITELNAKLRAKEFSAYELVRAFSQRLERLGPRYNALALPLTTAAIRRARDVDKELKREPEHREGRGSNDWALLDFGGFIVHVFSEQARRYYDLERLWRNVPRYDILDRSDSVMSGNSSPRLRASGDHS